MTNQETGHSFVESNKSNEKKTNLALKQAFQTEKYKQELAEIKARKQAKIEEIKAKTRLRQEKLRNEYSQEANSKDDKKWDEDWEWKKTMVCELSQKEFVSRLKEISENIFNKYWAPHPMVIIWQALHETWIWKSWVAKKKNNLFWFRLKNKEKWVFEYIRYDSMEHACEEYAKKMVQSKIYSKALKYKNEPKKYIAEIIKAWYCSTPPSKYIDRVEGCLNKFWWSLDDKINEA